MSGHPDADLTRLCPTCGGSGKQPGWPQPDEFGVFDPCDTCEGTGHPVVLSERGERCSPSATGESP